MKIVTIQYYIDEFINWLKINNQPYNEKYITTGNEKGYPYSGMCAAFGDFCYKNSIKANARGIIFDYITRKATEMPENNEFNINVDNTYWFPKYDWENRMKFLKHLTL